MRVFLICLSIMILNVGFFYYWFNELLYFWLLLDAVNLSHTIIEMIQNVWRREGLSDRQRIKDIIYFQIRKALVFFALRFALYLKQTIENNFNEEFIEKSKIKLKQFKPFKNIKKIF